MDDEFNAFLVQQLGSLSHRAAANKRVEPRRFQSEPEPRRDAGYQQQLQGGPEGCSANKAAEGLSSYQAAYQSGLSAFQRLQGSRPQSPAARSAPSQKSSASLPARPLGESPQLRGNNGNHCNGSSPSSEAGAAHGSEAVAIAAALAEMQKQLGSFYERTSDQLCRHQNEVQSSLADIRGSIEELRSDAKATSIAHSNGLSAVNERLEKIQHQLRGSAEPPVLERRPGRGATCGGSFAGGRFASAVKSLMPTERKVHEMHLTEDPRRTLARFFRPGDTRGPAGAIKRVSIFGSTIHDPLLCEDGKSHWFAIFRPCSSEAIQKMVFGDGCGKGLNVKGKSAKRGPLSGFVPFLQISDNLHRKDLSTSSKESRLEIFFKSEDARDEALEELEGVLEEMLFSVKGAQAALAQKEAGGQLSDEDEEECYKRLMYDMTDPRILRIDNFTETFGLDMPERLLREAFIFKKDLTTQPGWETGRNSTPAFSNMNLHSLRDSNRGINKAVIHTTILQYDTDEPMNPHGLVMAYAGETGVHAVVSDFDGFLVAQKGTHCKALPQEQVEMSLWCVERTEAILETPSAQSWSTRWLEVLAKEAMHPNKACMHQEHWPKYGFGDPTSYSVMEKLSLQMKDTGGVRHGAECFNFYFPQELDDEYLIIWEGFGEKKPWKYVSEPDTRKFLMERIGEGYSFPVNPAWPVRDPGWYEVLQALRTNPQAKESLNAWFPPGSGLLEAIDRIHEKYPSGFFEEQPMNGTASHIMAKALNEDDNAEESADLVLYEMRKQATLKRAKRKMKAILIVISMLNQSRRANARKKRGSRVSAGKIV